MNAATGTVARSGEARALYQRLLGWAFLAFNSLRVLSYLPTIAAIVLSGHSDQHSLWTWCTWLGANVTMACWLYENDGRRINRAVAVGIGNAVMCLATVLAIVLYR